MYIRKLISTFYKEYPEKPTAISPFLDSILPLARLIALKEKQPKQKYSYSSKEVNKRGRNEGAKVFERAMPFVTLDVDIVLQFMIWKKSRTYPQSVYGFLPRFSS